MPPRDQTQPRRLLVSVAVGIGLTLLGCSGSSDRAAAPLSSSSTTPPTTVSSTVTRTGTDLTQAVIGAQPQSSPENVAFVYERLPKTGLTTRIGRTRIVVAVPQSRTSGGATDVKVTGAEAYRYVQTYWYPANRGFDGFDIGAHRDLAFCKDGTTPAVGRTDANGVQWLFVDMNEQAFQDGLKLQFERLKKQGWDGVFFDRGYASLTGIDAANYDVWRRTSSCTDRPVVPGATFADSYLEIVHLAQSVGLKTMFNYGVSPFDPTTPLRPDPRDPPCILRLWTTCHKIDDAWNSTALVLDEAPSHPRDTEWARDFMVNRANEQDPAHGGQVVGLLTSAVLQSTERSVAYYEWARARLFSFPVGVNTGDGGCPQINTPCNRRRFFPELVSVTLGRPIEPEPTAQLCEPGSLINCLWKRRYERGAVVVNVSARPKTVSWQLGVEGCRYVLDVRTGQALADGRCTSTVVLSLDAWSGEPLQYSTKPF